MKMTFRNELTFLNSECFNANEQLAKIANKTATEILFIVNS